MASERLKLLAVLALALAILLPQPSHAASDPVREVAVELGVENVNRSALSCASDGRSYTLRGRLVGPARTLERPSGRKVATLYVHEYSFGRFFWNLSEVPGYDYVRQQALAGHVSVVFDRLGYDESGHPLGIDVCLGSHADMVRQVLDRLRAGDYGIEGLPAVAFDEVVLAAHSVGAVAAELAVHSFPEMELGGVVLFGWADSGLSERAVEQGIAQGSVCARGGEPAEPGAASGYAYFGQTEADFHANIFSEAEPAVVEAATRLRNRDPCGDVSSLPPATLVNSDRIGTIEDPVLLLWGAADANFEPGAGRRHAAAFTGSEDVTYAEFERTGHGLILERKAPRIRTTVSNWLAARGLVGSAARTVEGCSAATILTEGTGGADGLAGTGARDRLVGGPGDDDLSGGRGADCLRGGAGSDVLAGAGEGDDLGGDGGTDRISGGMGDDRIDGGSGDDRAFGGAGRDRMRGGAGADLISGGAGRDVIRGGRGRDRIRGGPGNDAIHSRDGRPELVSCGRGRDRVIADRFDRLSGCERVRS